VKLVPGCASLWASRGARVEGGSHDDGNRRGCLLECRQRWSRREDHVDSETDYLGNTFAEAIGPPFSPAPLGHEIPSVHVPDLPQPLQQRLHKWTPGCRPEVLGDGPQTEDANAIDLARRLGSADVCPRESTNRDVTDEGTALHHWTISSARASSDGGIVSPSALAVLRLMTSSNFVGCSTGRSAGVEPLRILSTNAAARQSALSEYST